VNYVKKKIAGLIWDLSEWSGIPLGKYAEPIFRIMIGANNNNSKKL